MAIVSKVWEALVLSAGMFSEVAAGKYGVGLIAAMAVIFGISTIATYLLLCVYSTAGL